MPAREKLTGADPCAIAERWRLEPELALRVWRAAEAMTAETGRDVWIISGFRTAAEQKQLEREGRPAAQDGLSSHRTCPARAVDIHAGFGVTNVLKAIWGRLVTFEGLRWGYPGTADPRTGIPAGWNHVDLGPRGSRASCDRC